MEREKMCSTCGCLFRMNKRYSLAQWAKQRFCSRSCSGVGATVSAQIRHQAAGPVAGEFVKHFVKGDGCWEWKGPIGAYGYGYLDHGGVRYRAHVLSLELDGRPVPKGKLACHHCDNPPCVRPDHLYVGTELDNARDARSRGRNARGVRQHCAKLNEDQVLAIRAALGTDAAIARAFGVSRATARCVRHGITWRHVQ